MSHIGSHQSHLETEYRQVTLIDLFQQYPIFESLCSFLGIGEIQSLIRSCTQLSHIYEHLLCIHWDIDAQLRRFVKYPTKLRRQLAKYNALIAGSFALQYFERVTWKDTGIDIFVEEDDAVGFCQYLTEAEGYRFTSNNEVGSWLSWAGVRKVFTIVF